MSKSLETIITVALSTPMGDPNDKNCIMGLPLHLQGDPGIGKSERVVAAAQSLGLPCAIIYPATRQPEDISGALIPDGKGGARSVSMLRAVNEMVEHKRGVIFLDELTGARPATQGAFLGFIQTRLAGETQLPPGIRIIAASNPPESAAGGWDLEPPMANRFAHFSIKPPTGDDWVAWLLSGHKERENSILDYEEQVKLNWYSAYAKMTGLFGSFIKRRGVLLTDMPKEGSRDRSRAWASPRTWEFALRVTATCEALRFTDDIQLDFVAACVGEAKAIEWNTFRQEANLPEPLDVLKNGFTPDKKRLDRSVAVYTGMAAFIVGQTDKDKKAEYAVDGWNRLKEACDAGLKDLAMGPAASLAHSGVGMMNKTTKDAASLVLRIFGHSKIGDFVTEFA